MQFTDKYAIITGAGSGLGAATAKALASRGTKLVLLDKEVSLVEALISDVGGRAVSCDVSCAKQVESVFSSMNHPLHICVNCAGVAPAMKMMSRSGAMTDEHFERVIHINLLGTFYMMRASYIHMCQHAGKEHTMTQGVIINTSSIAASEGQVGQIAYAASKAGVLGMMLPAVREFARHGIRINTISPGVMETPMMQGMPDKVQSSLLDQMPFPNRYGRPDEFAHLVCSLIENDYINGANIRLDAAMRMAAC